MGADFEDVNRGTPTRAERAHSLLAQLEPYLDALVCYASTIQEHDPNRIVKEIRELLDGSPPQAAGAEALRDEREAVACLYTAQGDSQPFMRISRGMLHVAGDIVAVQPLGPLPATPPAPVESAQVKEAVRKAMAYVEARADKMTPTIVLGDDESVDLTPYQSGYQAGLRCAMKDIRASLDLAPDENQP